MKRKCLEGKKKEKPSSFLMVMFSKKLHCIKKEWINPIEKKMQENKKRVFEAQNDKE